MSEQSHRPLGRFVATNDQIYTQAQESDEDARESEDEEMTELGDDDDDDDAATVIYISSSDDDDDNDDANSPEPSPVRPNNHLTLPPIKHLFDKLNLKKPFPSSPSPQSATAPQASSSRNPVVSSYQTPHHEATHPSAATAERPATFQRDINHPLAPLDIFTSSFKNKPEKEIFWGVLELYRAEVFVPIAMKIGLTSDAVIQIVLNLGRDRILRIANHTTRPYCGFSSDVFSPNNARSGWKYLFKWPLKELLCVTVAYESVPYVPVCRDMCGKLEEAFPAMRKVKDFKTKLAELRNRPYLVRADFARVAHEYAARRTEGGIAVARRKGINQEDFWLHLENVLFNQRLLQNHGYKFMSYVEHWRPRHLSYNPDIQGLMGLINHYLHDSEVLRERAWRMLSHLLYDPAGPHLLPVLKRYAIRPPPRHEGHSAGTAEYLQLQRNVVHWVKETTEL